MSPVRAVLAATELTTADTILFSGRSPSSSSSSSYSYSSVGGGVAGAATATERKKEREEEMREGEGGAVSLVVIPQEETCRAGHLHREEEETDSDTERCPGMSLVQREPHFSGPPLLFSPLISLPSPAASASASAAVNDSPSESGACDAEKGPRTVSAGAEGSSGEYQLNDTAADAAAERTEEAFVSKKHFESIVEHLMGVIRQSEVKFDELRAEIEALRKERTSQGSEYIGSRSVDQSVASGSIEASVERQRSSDALLAESSSDNRRLEPCGSEDRCLSDGNDAMNAIDSDLHESTRVDRSQLESVAAGRPLPSFAKMFSATEHSVEMDDDEFADMELKDAALLALSYPYQDRP